MTVRLDGFAERFATLGDAFASIGRAFADSLADGIVAVSESFALLAEMGYVASDVGDMSPEYGQDGNLSGHLDTRYRVRYSSCVGSEPTPSSTERPDAMPRRLDPKPCACGCGQTTKSGEFMRGHHTRRRGALVKTAKKHIDIIPTVSLANAAHMLGMRTKSVNYFAFRARSLARAA